MYAYSPKDTPSGKRRRTRQRPTVVHAPKAVRPPRSAFARSAIIKDRNVKVGLQTKFKRMWERARHFLLEHNLLSAHRIVLVVSSFIAFCVLLFGLYLFFFSSYFLVDTVVISRQDPEVDVDKVFRSLALLKGEHLFLISDHDIRDRLARDAFPDIDRVSIEKIYPRTIRVSVGTYPIVARIKNIGGLTYVVNSQGFVFTPRVERKDLPLFILPSYPELTGIARDTVEKISRVTHRKALLNPELVKDIIEKRSTIEKEFATTVSEVQVMPIEEELRFRLFDETWLWLDRKNNEEDQLKKLMVGRDKLKSAMQDYAYIDLRIPTKIFTCNLGTSCARNTKIQ